jgi:two-component system alkaline phosphatase synthesis response regulator PhoP
MKARKKILCVDDDESTLNIVSRFLATKGFEVLTSSNPFVAPLLEKEKPDLLVLDINMPLLSGDRIADVLSRQGYADNIPIIFFSSEPVEKIERVADRIPGASYVTKTGGLEQLVNKIRATLP